MSDGFKDVLRGMWRILGGLGIYRGVHKTDLFVCEFLPSLVHLKYFINEININIYQTKNIIQTGFWWSHFLYSNFSSLNFSWNTNNSN